MADYVGGRPTKRIQGLDALRTLAIVGVTLFHIFPDVVKVSVACATETRGFFGTSVSKISDEIPKGVAHIPTTKGNSKKEKYLKRN